MLKKTNKNVLVLKLPHVFFSPWNTGYTNTAEASMKIDFSKTNWLLQTRFNSSTNINTL